MAVDGLLVDTRHRIASTGCGLTHRIKFGQPADLGHQRHVFARAWVDAGNLGQRERQPVGLLLEFAGPVGAVEEIAPRDQPLVAKFSITLQWRGDGREPVQRAALLVGSHQPQLVVLAVQCQQSGGEGGQRFRRHTAPAEVGPRGAVAADRPQGDDAAVVIAVGARGIQDLLDCGGGGRIEVIGAEPALDHRARRSRPNPGGIGACPAKQMQAGHHHGLAGAGLAGQHGQPAVEFSGGRADRAE